MVWFWCELIILIELHRLVYINHLCIVCIAVFHLDQRKMAVASEGPNDFISMLYVLVVCLWIKPNYETTPISIYIPSIPSMHCMPFWSVKNVHGIGDGPIASLQCYLVKFSLIHKHATKVYIILWYKA